MDQIILLASNDLTQDAGTLELYLILRQEHSTYVSWVVDEDGNRFHGDYNTNLTVALKAYKMRCDQKCYDSQTQLPC